MLMMIDSKITPAQVTNSFHSLTLIVCSSFTGVTDLPALGRKMFHDD
jgi:hypothetical protein